MRQQWLSVSSVHMQSDTQHIQKHGSYVGCSKLSDPWGQMVNHSDLSYFQTHVNNSSRPQ